MFGLGLPEIIVILVLALIVLGPKRLPEAARSLGRGLAEFRRASTEIRSALSLEGASDPAPSTPSSAPGATPAGRPAGTAETSTGSAASSDGARGGRSGGPGSGDPKAGATASAEPIHSPLGIDALGDAASPPGSQRSAEKPASSSPEPGKAATEGDSDRR